MSPARRAIPEHAPAAVVVANRTTENWRYVAGRFRSYVESLEPSPAERSASLAVAASVEGMLRRRFPFVPGREAQPAARPVIVGSHAKNTDVRAISGIDVLFVIPDRYRGDPELRNGGGRNIWGPVLREVTGLLAARFAAVEMSRDGWLSVTATGAGDSRVGVRIIPAFLCGTDGYLVSANAAQVPGRPWRHLVPAAETARLDRADAESGDKARHLVRMLKAWRYAASVPVSAFAMELLACEYLSVWIYRQRSTLFYDWMIRDFFFWMTAQAGRQLPIPGSGETLLLGDAWLGRATAAQEMAAEASELERDNKAIAALACWRRIFGCRFGDPAPDATALGPRTPTPSGTARARRAGHA